MTEALKSWVVVESEAKRSTLSAYLGSNYRFVSSSGALWTLDVESEDPVGIDGDYQSKYRYTAVGERCVQSILKNISEIDEIIVASDPDRDGELIAWQLERSLRVHEVSVSIKRVHLSSLTRYAIESSLKSKQQINPNYADAQSLQRAMDYLYGYKFNKLLWNKLDRSLIIGRSQICALKLIHDREIEISQHTPQNKVDLEASWDTDNRHIRAKLEYEDKVEASDIAEHLQNNGLTVVSTRKRKTKTKTPGPMNTIALLQMAHSELGWEAYRTISVALELYNGVNVGHSEQGLITFPRTAGTEIDEITVRRTRNVIAKMYGPQQLSEDPLFYAKGGERNGEAQSAIVASLPEYEPGLIQSALSEDQHALYSLIWRRTLASQMTSAIYSVEETIFTSTDGNLWRSKTRTMIRAGFTDLTETETLVSESHHNYKEGEVIMESVSLEETLEKDSPPVRYTEHALMSAMYRNNIGDPGRWPNITRALTKNGHIKIRQGYIRPAHSASKLMEFFEKHIPSEINPKNSTSDQRLINGVATGANERQKVLTGYWTGLKEKLISADEKLPDITAPRHLGTNGDGLPVVIAMGNHNHFIAIGEQGTPEHKIITLQVKDPSKVTLKEALELARYPIELGSTKDYTKVEIRKKKGHYVCAFHRGEKKKVSAPIQKGTPDSLTLEEAENILNKHALGKESEVVKDFKDEGNETITVRNGRFGLYITDGSTNAPLPARYLKNLDSLNLETAAKRINAKKKLKNNGGR